LIFLIFAAEISQKEKYTYTVKINESIKIDNINLTLKEIIIQNSKSKVVFNCSIEEKGKKYRILNWQQT